MDPLSIAALAVGGIGSIIGAQSNRDAQESANYTNLKAVRETNKANLELYREQFADQYKMWLENNAYNSPASQVSRLRAAGLNPALMMQNGGTTGTAQTMSVPSANPMQAGHVEPALFNYSDVATNLAALGTSFNQMSQAHGNNISNSYLGQIKQAELMRSLADTKLALQNVKKGSAEESLLKAQYTMQSLQVKALQQNYGEYAQSFKLNNELLRANTSLARQQADTAKSQEMFNDIQTKLAGSELKYKDSMLQLAVKEYQQSIALLGANKKLTDKQAEEVWERILTQKQITKSQKNQNELFEATKPFAIQAARLQNDETVSRIHSNYYGSSGFKFGPIDVKYGSTDSPLLWHYSPVNGYQSGKFHRGSTSSW